MEARDFWTVLKEGRREVGATAKGVRYDRDVRDLNLPGPPRRQGFVCSSELGAVYWSDFPTLNLKQDHSFCKAN